MFWHFRRGFDCLRKKCVFPLDWEARAGEGVGDHPFPVPGIKWSPTRPPCFIDISKMRCIFDMSFPRGERSEWDTPRHPAAGGQARDLPLRGRGIPSAHTPRDGFPIGVGNDG